MKINVRTWLPLGGGSLGMILLLVVALGGSYGLLLPALALLIGGVAWLVLSWLHKHHADSPAQAQADADAMAQADVKTDSQSATGSQTVPRPAPVESNDLVADMVAQNRYALLLRPQIAENLDPTQLAIAQEAMEEAMAIVPEGDVFLCQPDERDDGEEQSLRSGAKVLRVEAALLDRYPVTNREFQQFVDAGAYEEMALWDNDIWPGVFGFVDQTGHSGPLYWSKGTYAAGMENHPVVGVNWYEAQAYSRWVGKRLPADAEWVKAGAWPMPVQRGLPSQRRYPWGDAWEPEYANTWSSGQFATCPVTDFEDGASVAGVYDLIGNVWEWTNDSYGLWHGVKYQNAENFKSLRGGAFDTYFESQANCQFQSGDSPLVRKHNIGFRCGLGLCDLQPATAVSSDADLSVSEFVLEEV